jgi:hypothetical protein
VINPPGARPGRPRGATGLVPAGAQMALGLVALLAPDRLARAAAGPTRPAPGWLVRVLGARMVAQGLIVVGLASRAARRASAVVDALHGASMVVAAVRAPAYRRSALISGGAAGVSAAATVWVRAA